jgi:diguanylate cyclase (GGDEF)-like protein
MTDVLLEPNRLAALARAAIIDTAPAPDFDALAETARLIFETAAGLVGFIDDHRYWAKAAAGLPRCEIAADTAICTRTVMEGRPVVVEDARTDHRGLVPVAVQALGVRFYAGAPIFTDDGLAIGTVCAYGPSPRRASEVQVRALEELAKLASALVRKHQAEVDAERSRGLLDLQHRELELRERRFLQTERLAQVGGWEIDLTSRTLACSDEMLRICGRPPGTPLDIAGAAALFLPPDRARLVAAIEGSLRTRATFDDEFELRAGPVTRRVRITGDVEVVDDKPQRVFGVAQDITDRHFDRMRLWHAANTDAATGLANRKRFMEMIAGSFETDDRVGLLLIDVDHLKEVNDTLGHEFGDALILAVAQRIARSCGGRATACRIGGDEFGVVATRIGSAAALGELAHRVIEAVAGPIEHAGRILVPSVTIGGAVRGDEAPDAESLRRNADLALYKAKESRRGSFVPFSAGLTSSIILRMEQVRSLDALIAAGAITPWYQPVVDLASGRFTGFEALARVVTAPGTARSIVDYRLGLDDPRNAARLTSAMMEAVSRDMAAWDGAGIHVPLVGLNLTTTDLVDDDLDARFARTFGSRGIPLSRLVMEVTETVFLSSATDHVARTLRRLREAGTTISLDDFGTGYASHTHLVTFPVDTIKIDRSFVSRIDIDPASEAVVSSLLDLGRKLGMDVVAEGVETETHLLRLQRLGCPFGQGYLFSRPIPARDVPDFVAAFGSTSLFGTKRACGA